MKRVSRVLVFVELPFPGGLFEPVLSFGYSALSRLGVPHICLFEFYSELQCVELGGMIS